jgi:hypothetical protein
MKKTLLALALFCSLFQVAHAQTTLVVATNILDNTGNLLTTGDWCFGSTCFAVTNGSISSGSAVTPGTATVTVTNGSVTFLTVPNVSIAGSFFSWNTFTVPSTGNIYGMGAPRLACTPGALYSQTDGAQNKWQCISQNGAGSWNGLPTPGTANSVTVGSTTTLGVGAPATVTNSGNGSATILNFGIPQGQQGPVGPAGTITASGVNGSFAVPGTLSNGSGAPPLLPADPTTSLQSVDKNYVDTTSHSGTWFREGTVISGTSSTQYAAQEPSVLVGSDPQLLNGLAGTVFKMWYTCGWTTEAVCYGESIDGENWTVAPAPVIAAGNPASHGYVFEVGATYYAYECNSPTACTGFSQYTSTNGTTWTLANSNVLTSGASGQWDSGPLGNIAITIQNGTWYALYDGSSASTGIYTDGVATSTDGIHWTKYASNPVGLVTATGGQCGGPDVHLVNGSYYAWVQCGPSSSANEPTDIYRFSSPDFFHWTIDAGGSPVFARATNDEGVNNSGGQVADFSMVAVGGSVYAFHDAVQTQSTPTENNDAIHIKLAIAPYTFAQLVATNEGNASDLHDNGSFYALHLNDCVNWNNGLTNAIPCPNNTGRFDIGDITLTGGAYPEMCLNCYWNGTSLLYVSNGAAAEFSLDAATGVLTYSIAPVGTAGSVVTTTPVWSSTPSGLSVDVPTTAPNIYTGNPVTSATGSLGATATCNNTCTSKAGSYLVTGETGTGTFLTLTWPATPAVQSCFVIEQGTTTWHGLSSGTVTTTGTTISTAISFAGGALYVSYHCDAPN